MENYCGNQLVYMKGKKMIEKKNIFIKCYIGFILLLNCLQIVLTIKKVKTKRIKLEKLLLKHFIRWERPRQKKMYIRLVSEFWNDT